MNEKNNKKLYTVWGSHTLNFTFELKTAEEIVYYILNDSETDKLKRKGLSGFYFNSENENPVGNIYDSKVNLKNKSNCKGVSNLVYLDFDNKNFILDDNQKDLIMEILSQLNEQIPISWKFSHSGNGFHILFLFDNIPSIDAWVAIRDHLGAKIENEFKRFYQLPEFKDDTGLRSTHMALSMNKTELYDFTNFLEGNTISYKKITEQEDFVDKLTKKIDKQTRDLAKSNGSNIIVNPTTKKIKCSNDERVIIALAIVSKTYDKGLDIFRKTIEPKGVLNESEKEWDRKLISIYNWAIGINPSFNKHHKSILDKYYPGIFEDKKESKEPEIETRYVNNYIDEDFDRIYNDLLLHKKIIIDGTTGIGKTTLMKKLIKKLQDDNLDRNIKLDMILPTVAGAKQQSDKAITGVGFIEPCVYMEPIIYSTYDKLPIIMKNRPRTVLALDEAHRPVKDITYRPEIIKMVERSFIQYDYVILLTGTVLNLWRLQDYKILRYRKLKETKVEAFLIKDIDDIMPFCPTKKYLIYNNNKEQNIGLYNKLTDEGYDCMNCYSGLTDENSDNSNEYKKLLETRLTDKQIIITTCVIEDSVSFDWPNDTVYVILDNSVEVIKQFSSRARKSNNSIIYLKNKIDNPYELLNSDFDYNNTLETLENNVINMNIELQKSYNEYNSKMGGNFRSISFEEYISNIYSQLTYIKNITIEKNRYYNLSKNGYSVCKFALLQDDFKEYNKRQTRKQWLDILCSFNIELDNSNLKKDITRQQLNNLKPESLIQKETLEEVIIKVTDHYQKIIDENIPFEIRLRMDNTVEIISNNINANYTSPYSVFNGKIIVVDHSKITMLIDKTIIELLAYKLPLDVIIKELKENCSVKEDLFHLKDSIKYNYLLHKNAPITFGRSTQGDIYGISDEVLKTKLNFITDLKNSITIGSKISLDNILKNIQDEYIPFAGNTTQLSVLLKQIFKIKKLKRENITINGKRQKGPQLYEILSEISYPFDFGYTGLFNF